ncbi:MAG: hypothetical protein QG664_341 [Patescibacteria group bacterium]|nr:hypothetical protein [Patescibacteria group bacterium]
MKMLNGLVSGMTEREALARVFGKHMDSLSPLVGIPCGYGAQDLKLMFAIWLDGLTELLEGSHSMPQVVCDDWQRKYLARWKQERVSSRRENQRVWSAIKTLSDEAKWMLGWSRMFLEAFYVERLRTVYPSAAEIIAPCLVELALLAVVDLLLAQRAVFFCAYVEPEFQASRKAWKQAERRARRAWGMSRHDRQVSVH